MTRESFRQRDLERIFKAAKAAGSVVTIDLKTMVITVQASEEAEQPIARKSPKELLAGLGKPRDRGRG